MNSSESDIILKLAKIFYEKFELDFVDDWEEIKDLNLMGYKMGLKPGDMVYLFFEIEKTFDISIPEDFIVNGNFNNLSNIVKIIQQLRNTSLVS